MDIYPPGEPCTSLVNFRLAYVDQLIRFEPKPLCARDQVINDGSRIKRCSQQHRCTRAQRAVETDDEAMYVKEGQAEQ